MLLANRGRAKLPLGFGPRAGLSGIPVAAGGGVPRPLATIVGRTVGVHFTSNSVLFGCAEPGFSLLLKPQKHP